MPRAKPQPPKRVRRRPAGDPDDLRRAMWQAIVRCEAIVLDPAAPRADILRASHALATLGGAYSRVYEQHELLPRLEAIEAAQDGARS